MNNSSYSKLRIFLILLSTILAPATCKPSFSSRLARQRHPASLSSSSAAADTITYSTLWSLRGGDAPKIRPCPHCKSTLHHGGKKECLWKSLPPKDAIQHAEHKVLIRTFTRIGVEALVGIVLIFLGETRSDMNQMIVPGALSMGIVLFEITNFLGEDAVKLLVAAMAMVGLLLLLQL
jgi:hypothetical protein